MTNRISRFFDMGGNPCPSASQISGMKSDGQHSFLNVRDNGLDLTSGDIVSARNEFAFRMRQRSDLDVPYSHRLFEDESDEPASQD